MRETHEIKASAVQEIALLAEKGVSPIRLITEDPRMVRYAVGNTVNSYPVPRPLGDIQLNSIGDLALVFHSPELSGQPLLFVNSCHAVVILDRLDRRERATLVLEMTAQWLAVQHELSKGVKGKPKEVIDWIRFNLQGCGDGVVNLRTILASTKFSATRTVDAEYGRGEDTLGTSTHASVDAAGDIPDNLNLQVPIYNVTGLAGISKTIRVGILVDHIEATVELRVYGGEVEKAARMAEADAQETIFAMVKAESASVCIGGSYVGSDS